MTNRLFCEHCDKFYEVNINDIRLMREKREDALRFAHNTYFFTDGCFFHKLKKTKERFSQVQGA